MDYVIGVDPGITGAVVVLSMDGRLEAASVCPSIPTGKGNKRDYDIDGMRRLIEPYSFMAGKQSRCAIELVGPMPKQGVTSMFNFGMGYGEWKGIVVSHLMQMTMVKPKQWQDEMLAGYPRGDAVKQSAVRVAKAKWPDIPIKLKKDWGIADAALIAEWHRVNSNTCTGTADCDCSRCAAQRLRRFEALRSLPPGCTATADCDCSSCAVQRLQRFEALRSLPPGCTATADCDCSSCAAQRLRRLDALKSLPPGCTATADCDCSRCVERKLEARQDEIFKLREESE